MRRSSSPCVVICGLMLFTACSGKGSSGGGGYVKQSGEISAAFRPKATEVARGEAAELLKQLDTTGKRNPGAVQSALSDRIAELGNFVCSEVKDHSAVKKGNVEDAVRDFDAVLTEQSMVEFARYPRLLTDLGFTTWGKWPPFALKQPAPPADSSVGDLATSVPEVVKPEFISSEGGLKLPSAGDPTYEEFKQWYAFGSGEDNGLFEAASALGEPFRQGIRSCFGGLQTSK
jgi:hypothetical protein